MFTLYTTPRSANGRKVLAVSHALELAPDTRIVDVYRGEGRRPGYLAINPLGKIPTLVDGDLTLWESNAIAIYLSEAHGDHRFWSREPARRADIARWMFWESSHWQPALSALLMQFARQRLYPGQGDAVPVTVDWRDERFAALAATLETQLARGAFLVDDQITLADFSVAAMMTYARPAGFPREAFPCIDGWYARIEALDAWTATESEPWI